MILHDVKYKTIDLTQIRRSIPNLFWSSVVDGGPASAQRLVFARVCLTGLHFTVQAWGDKGLRLRVIWVDVSGIKWIYICLDGNPLRLICE